MAHYTRVGEDGIVQSVIVISNQMEPTERDGVAFCESITGQSGWIKTSYNGNMRKNFAGIGFSYDSVRDAFIPPKPYPSWLLNETTCKWESPVPMPDSGGPYQWNEEEQNWDEIV